nr:Nif3-like dinuclear metal center hexameric protein [Salinimonas lutimaris]
MISRNELTQVLNNLLKPGEIKDYCPNGLQVEGTDKITRIVTGVTASQRLIDAAIEHQADALLVHHGYFWKGEPEPITGMKQRRIKALLQNDINLYAYHLPIDVHPQLGNNAQLANILGLENAAPLPGLKPDGIVFVAELSTPLSQQALTRRTEQALARSVLVEQAHEREVTRIAWCTGGGQGFIDQLVEHNIDVFISGEVSEKTIHSARELGISYMACGHHATERYGAKAVGEYLAGELGLDVTFIDIDNPA